MDSPQKENGYTPIANELMEALAKHRIPGEQMQCLFFIIRKTYGFNKKEDMISNSQFVKGTGLKKGNVSRAIKNLVEKRIVIKSDNRVPATYRFNKNYRMWRELSKKQPVIKSDKKLLSKVMDTKDNTKDKYNPTSYEVRLSKLLFSLMKERNEKYKQPKLQEWAVHIDRMIRIDGHTKEEIAKVIRWSQADAFWCTNIRSTQKLREQFPLLYEKTFGISPKEQRVELEQVTYGE